MHTLSPRPWAALRPAFCLFAGALILCILTACTALHEPLPDAEKRPVLLSFGKYVTPDPARNPINPPERFTGYHVGADFEVTRHELATDVAVFAICSGSVAYSGFAEGYGGLVVEHCTINAEPVTVLYGHLLLAQLPESGAALAAGDEIAVLAPAQSADSGGNRKHLHLGIHRGVPVDYLGYVQTQAELSDYIDPLSVLPHRSHGTGGTLKAYWQ